MTEQDVEIFLAVVRWGSISAAAEAMFITQPAVSRHIRELEQELGCPLVRRSKGRRHIELTEQGERFIATARKWRELWRETRELAAGERRPS
ncbi:MAG: LysR family transcriptional regulator [Oscillospiraceae bacterium]